jgi:hypothetical protein
MKVHSGRCLAEQSLGSRENGPQKRNGAIEKMSASRTVEELSEELAGRWTVFFAPKDWPDRLRLLQELLEQLQEDLGDLDLYCSISSALIRKLIEGLAPGPVETVAQAHIYANSDSEQHRRAACEWLAQHNVTSLTAKLASS